MANNPVVRDLVAARGLRIPPDTWFVGGERNTASNDIHLFDVDMVPEHARALLDHAGKALEEARRRILMTRESIAVPPDYAAEMMPYDTRAGEFRVHYAGFFDPGFGWDINAKRASGSRGVLEVRSHEVPFLLEHGQTVGWLKYERMAARPDILYGRDMASNYQGQGLKLSKQFAPLRRQR
jgi:deoxycytidine triphosphate deaminase